MHRLRQMTHTAASRTGPQPRSAFAGATIWALLGGMSAVLVAGSLVSPSAAIAQDCTGGLVNPMGGATPIGSDAGYTVYSPGDGVFGNSELEGTIAIGGGATFGAAGGGSGSYPIFQGGVGGNADYGVPFIDGDLNRVLLNEFRLPSADAPQRVAQVQVRIDGTPAAGVKIVDQSTPPDYTILPAYDSTGSTYSLDPSAGGTNQSPQISSTPQLWDGGAGGASWTTAAASFSDYFPTDTGASILASAAYVSPLSVSVGGEAAVTIDPAGPNLLTLPDFGAAAKFTMTGFAADAPLVVRVLPSDVVDGQLRLPSYAYPGRDAPDNAGIGYVLFDLSAIAGDVLVTSRGGEPVRGSIYAPAAHVIFPPGAQGGVEFEGQVIAGDFTALQAGKEIHTNLFAGVFPCGDDPIGGFSLEKALAGGISPADLPADTVFDVTASWSLDGTAFEEHYQLPADGTRVDGPQDLPVGTIVEFTEAPAPDVPGWAFDGAVFAPDSIVIAEGENTSVTVTNTYSAVGGFSVAKVLDGVADGHLPADLSFRVVAVWQIDGVPQLSWFDLSPDGTVAAGPQDLPAGTTVTFFEVGRSDIDGYAFQGATLSPRQIVVEQASDVLVTASNSYLPIAPGTGGFALSKQIEGIDAGEFPPGTMFEVTASWTVDGSPVQQVFAVPADGSIVPGPQDLPPGTVVEFTESDPAASTPDGATLDSWGVTPEQIVVEAGTVTQVVATNTYTSAEPVGGFDLQKRYDATSGIDGTDFAAGTTFPVTAVRFVGVVPVVETFDLPADGTLVEGPDDLAVGSRVAFFELGDPVVPDGYEFSGVSFDADGVAVSPAIITIGEASTATITATNTYLPVGGFALSKAIVGTDASAFPAGTMFSVVAWTRIDGTFDWEAYQVPADGTAVEGPQNLPAGTTVHFIEVEPASPDGYAFTDVTFSPATVVIGQGANTEVTATNTYRLLAGGFSVQKTITGTGASLVPDSTLFEVAYFLDGSPTAAGSLSVPASGEVVAGPQDLPVGTTVTFQEVSDPPDIPGTAWGAPVFVPDELVIAADVNATVELTNSLRLLAGGFSLHKVVAGTGASLIPSSATFDVAYFLNGDDTAAGTMTLSVSGDIVDGPQDLPDGTVVTFAEVARPAVDGGDWSGGATFSPSRIVIADSEVTEVTLTNTFDAHPLPTAGFPISAQVVVAAILALLLGITILVLRRSGGRVLRSRQQGDES